MPRLCINVSPALKQRIDLLHPKLEKSHGVRHVSQTIRMALARGLRHLETEADVEISDRPGVPRAASS